MTVARHPTFARFVGVRLVKRLVWLVALGTALVGIGVLVIRWGTPLRTFR
jgi:hypothetical protein